jgi:glycopeptide antibiotics resistance protein
LVAINETLILAIAIFTWIVYRLINWRRAGRLAIGREVLVNLFFGYLLTVSRLTFWPMYINVADLQPKQANFQPLVKTLHMLRYMSPYVVMNILGNLLLLAPLGVFLPVLSPSYRRWWATVGTGFLVTLFIELFQFFLAVRVFDVDDLILNTLGVGLGYGLFVLLAKIPFLARWLHGSTK